jgi:hypothetical protein
MIEKSFLRQLHFHFRAIFLQAIFRMLFEPPGRDLALTDAAQHR